jgi:hypothetical protein
VADHSANHAVHAAANVLQSTLTQYSVIQIALSLRLEF